MVIIKGKCWSSCHNKKIVESLTNFAKQWPKVRRFLHKMCSGEHMPFFPMVLLCYFMMGLDRVFYVEFDDIFILLLTLTVQKL